MTFPANKRVEGKGEEDKGWMEGRKERKERKGGSLTFEIAIAVGLSVCSEREGKKSSARFYRG